MIGALLTPEGVGRIERVVVPIGDRRDRGAQQRPFPEIEEEEVDEESTDTPAKPETKLPVSDERAEDDPTIDLLVIGSIVPSRQKLPGFEADSLIH
jgi:hypothetical protein